MQTPVPMGLPRQQTGPGAATAPAPSGVSFSPDTNTAPRRRIVRQQTGVWDTHAQIEELATLEAQLKEKQLQANQLEEEKCQLEKIVEAHKQEQLANVRAHIEQLRAEVHGAQ